MISTKSFKEVMEKIHQKVSEEKELLVKNGVSVKGTSENEDIDVLLRRTKDTSFKVLVMGRFSSGKSAFINVLLGEKLLPEGAMPMTALITEIYYGEEKKVIMFPKEGQWPSVQNAVLESAKNARPKLIAPEFFAITAQMNT